MPAVFFRNNVMMPVDKLFVASAILLMALAGVLPAQQTTTPTHASPPQAKTQKEFADYNAAYATAGGAAIEKAADAFAATYPQSELRSYLYAKAMHDYQTENNPDKMLAMGNKVIALDPDNSIALVLTATVLADSLADSDKDRAQKIATIQKNATHALDTVDTSFTPPQNATPEQIAAYKSTLRSMARSALGIMELKNDNDAQAEKDLQEAASLNKVSPDPYIWYHLGLAQDHQKKYAEALASINQALQYTASNPDLEKLAKGERQRLMDLTGSAPASSQKPPQ
jgi:tetratricopeptide (TPR) repeat protein